MGAAQYVFMGMMFLNLLAAVIIDGTPKEGEHKFSHSLFSCGLLTSVLYWGGFFSGGGLYV